MSAEAVEIIKAVAAALATVLTAVFVFLGVVYSSRKTSNTKKPVAENPDTGKALTEFNGTQNEFMALVIADNAALRAGQNRQDQVLKEQNQTIDELKDMVESIKLHQDNFLSAVRRYLEKIALAWKVSDTMPWPDEEDFHILEDTLPIKGFNKRTKES